MKILCFFLLFFLISCESKNNSQQRISVVGTWKLISGMIIKKNDTTIIDYTRNQTMIKIINETHFAFLKHDLNKGKDSTAVFGSGGGSYSLVNDQYTEHLEYCSYREWEDHHFSFTVSIKNDTLIQAGIEKIESLAVDQINIEKYIRIKK